ncbi:MAG TPA: Cof-type HAD-IIB family hydrolase [Candidatus Ozemobacteraceae bacterium]|nr:Cof-type HAD-IIB family hydrolase [Candidatus Ozemobacteraceae bacterium]
MSGSKKTGIALLPGQRPADAVADKKLIFLDIDGTLINYGQKAPASGLRAVVQAKKSGHGIYLCTGRNKAQIYPDIADIEWDGIIGSNGCFIEVRGKMIADRVISKEKVAHAINWLNANDIGFYAESSCDTFASQNFLERTARIYGAANTENQQKVRDVFPQIIYGADLHRDDLNKINFVWNSSLDINAVQQEFSGDFTARVWSLTGRGDEFCELGQPEVNKGIAIGLLLDYLGADRADTIGFGDAVSDIEMLEYCGTGVAMGNAKPELKRIADYVTSDVDADGLWKAFKHLGII